MDVEDTPDAYICRWCGCNRAFSSQALLSLHVNTKHVPDDAVTPMACQWSDCSRAGKVFSARYKLQVHLRVHTLEKPHQCPECEKRFTRHENLKIHTRTHTGEKPYMCPMAGCFKAYSNSSDRFKHLRTHEVDRPFLCKVPGCTKRYTDPSSLRKHFRTIHRHIELSKVTDLKRRNSPSMEALQQTNQHMYLHSFLPSTWPDYWNPTASTMQWPPILHSNPVQRSPSQTSTDSDESGNLRISVTDSESGESESHPSPNNNCTNETHVASVATQTNSSCSDCSILLKLLSEPKITEAQRVIWQRWMECRQELPLDLTIKS